MQLFRLAGIICLLATCCFAQEAIDARGKSYIEIYGHLARYETNGDPRHQKILSGILTITDPRNLVAGSRFNYELLVTNDSNASVVIPKTLDWNEVDDGHAGQTFVRATLSIQMECLKYSSGDLDHFVLYGSEQRPETLVMLKPGDAVRVLGTGLMPLPPTVSCQSEDTATFRLFFDVFATTLQREAEPALPDAYRIDERLAVVANAKRKYPITNPH